MPPNAIAGVCADSGGSSNSAAGKAVQEVFIVTTLTNEQLEVVIAIALK